MSSKKKEYIKIQEDRSCSRKKDKSDNKEEKGSEGGEEDGDRDAELRVKKYDYLNKYSQHQILGEMKAKARKEMDHEVERRCRWERIERRERERKSVGEGKISLPKRNGKSRSYSRSSSKSKPKQKSNSSAHYLYLQAYQNNIPQDTLPYSLSPPQKAPTLATQPQKSLQKILTKIPKPSNSLSLEISHQNEIFKGQVTEYRTMVAKLEIELAHAQERLLMGQQSFLKERLCYEGMIKELRDQVLGLRGYRERYEILNQEMIKMSARIVELEGHNKENRNLFNCYDENISQNRQRSKGKIKKANENTHTLQKQIFQTIESLIAGNESKKTDIKLTAYSTDILESLSRLATKNKKHEDFIFNIREMYRKIEKNNERGNDDPTVRQLWKWLKLLGSHYSFMMEIKSLLAEKVGIGEVECKNKEIKEILELVLIKL